MTILTQVCTFSSRQLYGILQVTCNDNLDFFIRVEEMSFIKYSAKMHKICEKTNKLNRLSLIKLSKSSL